MIMRFLKSAFALVLTVLASCAPVPNSVQGALEPVSLQASDQPFKRGVNVLGYDPYWTNSGERRFEWRHFAEIRRGGFDFVRVNLQAFSHMDSANRLDPAWLAKLDDVVREAQQAGLGVILDEHDFDVCSNDLAMCRATLS